MSAPSFVDLIDAVADILETTTDYVLVVRDPVYSTDTVDYARMLKADGVVDGWVVMAGQEEEELERGVDGADQTCYIECVAMVSANAERATTASFPYFGGKVQQAKDAFRVQTTRALGITTSGVTVRQYGLYAPEGYVTANLATGGVDTELVHIAAMRMRVFVSVC
jgi:hypothetical protein